jgi:hypothetical protein
MSLSILYIIICRSRYVKSSKGYENSYDDHWTIVKIFLCTFEELRICLVCRSDKLFTVRCYNGFDTYIGKFISILGYLFWVYVARLDGRKFHDDLDEFQSETLWWILPWRLSILTALVAAKEGFCVQEFVIKLGVVLSMVVLWRFIVWQ